MYLSCYLFIIQFSSIHRFWCQDFEGKLSEIIANLLISKYQNSSPNKRKRSLKNNSTQNTAPTSDQVKHPHNRPMCFVLHKTKILDRFMEFFSSSLFLVALSSGVFSEKLSSW